MAGPAAGHHFGRPAVDGGPGEPSRVQPTHFRHEPEPGPYGRVITRPARPNPLRRDRERNPAVPLRPVDDYVFVPGHWTAPAGAPAEHGTPTSSSAAVSSA